MDLDLNDNMLAASAPHDPATTPVTETGVTPEAGDSTPTQTGLATLQGGDEPDCELTVFNGGCDDDTTDMENHPGAPPWLRNNPGCPHRPLPTPSGGDEPEAAGATDSWDDRTMPAVFSAIQGMGALMVTYCVAAAGPPEAHQPYGDDPRRAFLTACGNLADDLDAAAGEFDAVADALEDAAGAPDHVCDCCGEEHYDVADLADTAARRCSRLAEMVAKGGAMDREAVGLHSDLVLNVVSLFSAMAAEYPDVLDEFWPDLRANSAAA